ncbi:alpha/beta fold hydrolase [Baekduia soli]|uniref:Alpha/beta fold hydrolase n=1 Tax=Baekduia soli TaxID=496014 RepID=A0A5B8U5U4_9ACTN|nr:alpha/beta fold hydrolase [Baekduia soli]QEC48022.1 alpha/beta fold hydrolase [Baekduia soli]
MAPRPSTGPPPESRMVRVGDLRLRVSRQGAGPPLLLIGGLGANLEMWRPLRRHLGDRHTIAFDAPGTGRSTTPRIPLRMRALARVVRGLLDELGEDRVDVLGYSFGGALAQQLAHDAPARVGRLILAATNSGAVSVPGRPLSVVHLMSPLRYHSAEYLRRAVPVMAGGRTARDPEALRRHTADRLVAPPSLWGYQSQMYAMTGWTSALWLHRLPCPTLVLSGDDDPLVPLANARFLARRIPGARLHIVPGGGHLFLIDQPEDAADVITQFLAG